MPVAARLHGAAITAVEKLIGSSSSIAEGELQVAVKKNSKVTKT